MNNSSARLFSIIFSLSVVGGAWLLFEYSQIPQQRPEDTSPSTKSAPALKTPPEIEPMRQVDPIQSQPVGIVSTYHCKGASGTVYRDHPCQPNEREIKVTTSRIVDSRPDETARLRDRATAIEQARIASAPQSPVAVVDAKKRPAVCDDVDRQVAQIDAELRMPNYPARIDYLKGERKKYMDLRFSSGC